MSDDTDRMIRTAFERQSRRVAAHVDAQAGLEGIRKPSTMARRALVPALAAAVVVIAAIGVVAALRFFGGGTEPVVGPTTTSATSTTSTTVAPSTTTVPATTTTPTTNPGPVTVGYHVVGVAPDDVLNVRENPGANYPIVGTLPPDADDVDLTGYAATVGDSVWYEVRLDSSTRGWVNGSFLARPTAWEAGFDTLACQADDAAYGDEQVSPDPASASDAGFILDVFGYSDGECSRVVMVLGSGDGAGAIPGDWTLDPASTVPAGIVTTGGTSVVAVSLPGIKAVRPLANTVELPDGVALTTRDESLSLPGDLTERVFYDANRRAAVRYLADPARIVIDVRTAPTGTGLDVAAKRTGLFVVMPVQVDLNGPGVELPITVTGWGRPFEATGSTELRRAASTPGTGAPVEATFSGGWPGTQVASTYSFMTTDYIDAWGAFTFTIDGLAPGSYELWVGEYPASGGPKVGVYQTFTVAG